MTVKQKNAVSAATAELPYFDAPHAEGLDHEDLLQNPRLLTEVLPVAESALWGGWEDPDHSTVRSDEDHLPIQEALLAFHAAGHDAVYVDAAQSDEDDEGGIILQDQFLPFLGWLAISAAGAHAAGPTSYEVSGRILLGPITDASGLSVGIFRADGVALNGKGVVFSAGGRYSIEVQDPYAGVVVLRVIDATTGADFLDEAERKVLDMTQDYRALGVVDGVNNVVIDINAMTEMIAVFLGLTSGNEGASSVDVLDNLPADIDLTQVDLTTVVEQTVSKVEAWLGLVPGDLSKPAEAVILDNDKPNPDVNLTGQFLAVVSGLTATTGEDSQAVIERLVADLRNEEWSDDLVRDVIVAAERAGAEALDVGTALGWMPEQVEQVTTSWRVIETAATSPEAPRPTETDYRNLGVNFSSLPAPTDALASLVGSALTVRTQAPPDSVAELRDLVNSSARLYGTMTGDTTVATVTVADLNQLGIENVTQEQLPTVVELLTQGVPTDQPVPAVQELAKQIAVAIALFDLNPLTNTVRENAAVDTPVGITAKASGTSSGSTVTYRLMDDAGGLFKIDPGSGLVSTTSTPIDREVGGATRTIGVTATSTDTSGVTQTSQQSFVIAIADQNEFAVSAILDVNAEADALTSAGVALHGQVAENAVADALVGITARATDADASSVIRYSLSQNEGGFFKIDEKTGVVSTTNVLTNREVDGATRTIEITATSTDESGAIQTSQQIFVIAIADQNEFAVSAVADVNSAADAFTSAGVALHGLVAENATENTVVGITAKATDTDANSVITYSLSDDANGRFQIGAASGMVTTTGKAIDREADDGATLSIEVTATSTDESGAKQTNKQRFVIAVTDQNEFEVSALTDSDVTADVAELSSGAVNENAAENMRVGITAHATDADASSVIRYSLSQNEGGFFKIDEKTGVVITTNVLINSEVDGATRTIEVTATSTDTSGVTQTSQQSFVIAIADQNEFEVSALMDSDVMADVTELSSGAVNENAAENMRVGITARATDADASSVIRYSLSQNEGGFFKIDEKTGVVSTTDVLINREVDGATRTIEVTATSTDEIGAKQTSKQHFVIAVTDQNEFEVSALTDSDVTADVAELSSGAVNENAAENMRVGITAHATDADASSVIRYSLSQNEGGFFKIDEKTGVVSTTNVQVDRETHGATRTIEVTATSTDTSGVTQTSQQSFVIAIADQNEFAVSAILDVNAEADALTSAGVALHGQVAENAVADTLVGITAKATDADASSVIRYSLSQNEGGFFKIDEKTGVVSTTDVLINREVDGATRTIEVTATSTDESGIIQTSQQSFVIQIDNVFETRALVISDLPSTTSSIQENTETDSEAAVVARLQLLGGDFAPEGDVTWMMASETDTGFFTLTQDGTVRLNRADFEAAYTNGDLGEGNETLDNRYTIKVQAKDQQGNLSQEVTLTVAVTDDDDEALPGDQSVVVSAGVATVPEFTGVGSASPAVIGVATFVNAIGMANWAFSGTDAAQFGFENGKNIGFARLTFAAPDYEAEKATGRTNFVYKATLTGTDDDGNEVQKEISLTLENVDFNIVGMPAGPLSINENVATNSDQAVVARLSLSGDQHPVNWSMVAGDTNRFEWAYEDASKAWVLRLKQADYEGAWENGVLKSGAEGNDNDYTVTVRADDGFDHAHEVSVRVLVTDVEEHPSDRRVDGLADMPQSLVESVQPTLLGTPRFFNAQGEVTWDIHPGDTLSSSLFYKDEKGQLWFSAADYENPQGLAANPQTYTAQLTGTDQDGNLFQLGVDIQVSDRPLMIQLSPSNGVAQVGETLTQADGSRVSTWSVVEHRLGDTTRHAIGTVALDALASDAAHGNLTWTLDKDYEDVSLFELNTNGLLSLKAMDYEKLPDSFDGDKVYEVRLTALDEKGQTTSHVVGVTILDDDAESASFAVTGLAATPYTRDENIAVTDANALLGVISVVDGGVYNGEITWSLAGDDKHRFTLNERTGELRLKPQNFEELDTDNRHHVTVIGTDSDHNAQSMDVVVDVTNVREVRSFDLAVNGVWWFDVALGGVLIPIPAGQSVAIPLGVWGEAPEGLLHVTDTTYLAMGDEANRLDYTFNSQTNTLIFDTVNQSGKEYAFWGQLEDQDGNKTDNFFVLFKTFISQTAPMLNNSTGVAANSAEDAEWVEITLSHLIRAGDGYDPNAGDSIRTFFVEKLNTGTLKIGKSWESATDYSANNDVIGEVGDEIRRAYWTPSENANGDISAFWVKALDGDSFDVSSPPPDASSTLDVLVHVDPKHDAPVIKSDGGSYLTITNPTTPISELLNWSDPDGGGSVPSRITVEFTQGYRADVDSLSLSASLLTDFSFQQQADPSMWQLSLNIASELEPFELTNAWSEALRGILYTHTATGTDVDRTPRELVFTAWDQVDPELSGSYAMHLHLVL